MAELIRLNLTDLHRGERLRPVDMDIAAAIGSSFEERGQISPITVRRAPAKNEGAKPFTLITGAHRCAAADIIGWTELDALVVQANGAEAQLMEIAENVYRNELSPLDRALFVLKYRELWEETHGEIDRTRNLKKGQSLPKGQDAPSGIFAPGRELSKHVQERLGFGPDTYKRAIRIAQNLHAKLRAALRGTGAEWDQSLLLKLAKMEPAKQLQATVAFELCGGDVKAAMKALEPEKGRMDETERLVIRLRDTLSRLSKADRDAALYEMGYKLVELEKHEPAGRDVKSAAVSGSFAKRAASRRR